MYMTNVPAETAKYLYEAQVNMSKAIEKYWKENVRLIMTGFAALNGSAALNALCCE